MKALAWVVLLCVSLFTSVAHAYDERWPDYGVRATDRGNSGSATYFQGFESPCFGPPYQPGTGELDWIRYYSEVVRVPTGTGGIASRNGFNHAHILPPLPSAPGVNTGAYTRLGGYRTGFGGGFTIALDVYFDLSDPRVLSGVNAAYGWDLTTAVNNQAGDHRRDFIFHTASNTSGQILIGVSNTSNFAPIGNLASGPHYVVGTSGWYTMEWVYRDAGNGTLAVDLNVRNSAGTLVFTRTLNIAADVIASQIGGNRYLWFTFMQSDRLPMDNARLNSGIREALYASNPIPGSSLNAGNANLGNPAPGTTLNVQNQGTLRLEVCSCSITGTAEYGVASRIFGSVTIDNGDTGTITGAQSGILSEGAAVTVNNSGSIRGNGTRDNLTTVPAAGISIAVGDNVVNNSGTISGAGFGITTLYYKNPLTGALEPRAVNTIINNSGSIIGDSNDGVRLIGGGSIANSGLIAGRVGGSADGVSMFAMNGQNISGQFGMPLYGISGMPAFSGNWFWVDETNGSDAISPPHPG